MSPTHCCWGACASDPAYFSMSSTAGDAAGEPGREARRALQAAVQGVHTGGLTSSATTTPNMPTSGPGNLMPWEASTALMATSTAYITPEGSREC